MYSLLLSGILFIKRRSRLVSGPHISPHASFASFALLADEVVSIMTIHEIHKWL